LTLLGRTDVDTSPDAKHYARHAIVRLVSCPLEHAEQAVREELASAGFGILTEIDVAAVFKAKLGIERPALRILGACNPTLAHAALEAASEAALLLPCNVVLEEFGGSTKISAIDPMQLMASPELSLVAADAADRLESALDRVVARLLHHCV
jgi:uncharacterized protein (DUF302 family)